MLQYPYGVYPNGNTIDTSTPFNFSMFVSGTSCVAYKLTILENVSGKSFYDGAKVILPQKLYNQELLEITNNETLDTGLEYIYNYKLWTDVADIPVTTGVVLDSLGFLTLIIGQYNLIKKDHTIIINGESKKIASYTWDGETNRGILVLQEPLTSQPQANDVFKIVSDFIETPFYYFIAQDTPNLKFANIPSLIANRNFEFIGEYSQAQGSPIQKYQYELFVKVADDYILLDKTLEIYNSKLTYSYNGFINNNYYKIVLTTTNQNNIMLKIEKEFSVQYNEPISSGSLIATLDNNQHNCEIIVDSFDEDIIYWELYRQIVDEPIREYVGRIYPSNKTFLDYCVTNHKRYLWQVSPITPNFTAQEINSNIVETNWGDWSILSLNKVGDKYKPTQIVKLNLNLESAEMTQNIDVVYHKNYTKYPKASQGVSDYLTGSITCLLGQIKHIKSTFYSEDDFTINQWRKFVDNGEPKLLKDRAGNKYLISISSSSSNVDDVSYQQVNTINFSFTEIGDSENILIEV